MKKSGLMAALMFAACCTSAHALPITIDAVQTGGFYADGSANNSTGFQNYFVGYGTTPGFGRTPERRSFFWFSLAGISDPIGSATIHLKLPFGGLIFGKGPGDPSTDTIVADATEEFQLSATPLAPGFVTSPLLSLAEGVTIFDSFASVPTAAPRVFGGGAPPPPPDGSIDIALNAAGLFWLNTHLGGDVIFTGWMPTWSEDLRPEPFPPPDFFEASELIFGLTDVVAPGLPAGSFPFPSLTLGILTPAAVPEPSTLALFGAGLAGLGALRRRRKAKA